MTTINNFIQMLVNNPYVILLMIIIVAVAVYAFEKGKNGLYAAALYLVSVAEEEWGSKTGQIKFAEVISSIKKTYPIISLFIREEKLEQIIEDSLIEMKRILADKQAAEKELE